MLAPLVVLLLGLRLDGGEREPEPGSPLFTRVAAETAFDDTLTASLYLMGWNVLIHNDGPPPGKPIWVTPSDAEACSAAGSMGADLVLTGTVDEVKLGPDAYDAKVSLRALNQKACVPVAVIKDFTCKVPDGGVQCHKEGEALKLAAETVATTFTGPLLHKFARQKLLLLVTEGIQGMDRPYAWWLQPPPALMVKPAPKPEPKAAAKPAQNADAKPDDKSKRAAGAAHGAAPSPER